MCETVRLFTTKFSRNVASVLLLPALVWGAAGYYILSSPDGEIQAVVPTDWEQVDLHVPGAEIQAASSARQLYFAVNGVRRKDVASTIDDFAANDLQITARRFADSSVSEPSYLTINGHRGTQYQFHATLPRSQIRVGFLITFMETENHFLKIAGWTTESRFTTAAVAQLELMTEHVREAKGR
jgi:hypothetical protein